MTKLKLEFKREDGTTKKFNKGKPFLLPNWTVMKHKAVLEEINKLPQNASEEDKDIAFQFFCIYEGLKVVDPSVELEDIKSIHPVVLAELFEAIYSEGKCDIYFRDKGKKGKSK
jgi:hypothetical protein